MYKSIIQIKVNLIENGIINRFYVDKKSSAVSFNGYTKTIPASALNGWLTKFFSLIRKYGTSPDGIYDRGNIATIEIVESKKCFDFVIGGRALELLNSLITKIM